MERTHRKILLKASLVCGLGAWFVSSYLLLAVVRAGETIFGCGTGSGCDAVLGSRWSEWLGIPVSLFAVVFYGALCLGVIALLNRWIDRVRWLPWVVTVAWHGGMVILWFFLLQAYVIGSFCVYCMTTHGLGLLAIFFLILYMRGMKVRIGISRYALAIALTAGFVSTHIVAAPNQMSVIDSSKVGVEGESIQFGTPKKSRKVHLLENKISFDVYQTPCIGLPEAEHVILELFDYTCPHCRDLHKHLHKVTEHYGDQLVIVAFPVPLNSSCNPSILHDSPKHQDACVYAKYSLAVCAQDPTKFQEFHDWMMKGEKQPSLARARAEAEKLIETGSLNDAINQPRVQEWLDDGIKLYKFTRLGGIPKLIAGKKVVTIKHTTLPDLLAFLEGNLGIKTASE